MKNNNQTEAIKQEGDEIGKPFTWNKMITSIAYLYFANFKHF